ncbi:phage integrase central domain-containing protein [Loktanella sp. DJP18]|uniref:phage integrase central domain-containing protein n=1 Tax=Loktanella sp. DJP18 TaxID=3409788 RepID=UPI003BB69F6C
MLQNNAFPKIGYRSIDEIAAQGIVEVLQPTIWLDKHETARRVLQRMKVVFDWANDQTER